MAPRVVRTSKYRHLYGTGSKKENCYDGIQASLDQNDWHLAKTNGRFLSIDWESGVGGSFLVWPVERVGKLPTGGDLPLFTGGHSGPVLDTDFHPFNDYIIASAGDDGKVVLWGIPESGEDFNGGGNRTPLASLLGHDRRVVDLAWHPAAENVLASASHDLTVRIWDVTTGQTKMTLGGHGDAVIDQGWSIRGDMLLTSSRDKTIRLFDPRASEKAIAEKAAAHAGVKGIRLVWMGEDDSKFISTGFGRGSEREMALWDSRNMTNPVATSAIDTASGPLLPFYDADCGVLYLAGKGDGNIRYYEIINEEPYFYALGEYKSTDPQRGLAMLPKRRVSVSDNEVARFYKVYGSQAVIEPITFRVPRRDHSHFQSDIYPEALSAEPSMTSEEFFAGRTTPPKRMTLRDGFVSTAASQSGDITTINSNSNGNNMSKSGGSIGNFMSSINGSNASMSNVDLLLQQSEPPKDEAALKGAWSKLIKEIESLKAEVSQKNVRIRQLESQLEKS